MFIFGAGRRGKSRLRPLCGNRFSRPRRRGDICFITVAGFLNGPASRKCATICGAPVPKSGSLIARRRGINPTYDTHLSRRPATVCIVLAARKLSKSTEEAARVRFTVCQGARAKKTSRRSESFPFLNPTGSIVRPVGGIHSCLPRLAFGRCVLRSKICSCTTALA